MANTIVLTKLSNGNILIDNNGALVSYPSTAKLIKKTDSTEIYSPEGDLIATLKPEAVEKVVREDTTETLISDNDTLFTELSTFFFFKLKASEGVFERGSGIESVQYAGPSFPADASGNYATAISHGGVASGSGSVSLAGWAANAGGQNSLAAMSGSLTSARDTIAAGTNTEARNIGDFVTCGGDRTEAQLGRWGCSVQTPDAVPRGLRSVFGGFFSIPVDTAFLIQYSVIGIDVTTKDICSFEGFGIIRNIAGTTSIVGTPTKNVIHKDASLAATDVDLLANDAADELDLKVTGIAALMRWSGRIDYNEIS